jgi:uncharacterized protein YecE (DUF72 family)
MADWRLGTMGFGYDDWSGPFYPPGLKSTDRLAYYATHFNSVELDTTFHAVPDVSRVRKWAAAVPEDFRFCVKTPRLITHDSPLDAPATLAEMRSFLDVVRGGMRDKLGAVLVQFAPSFSFDSYGKLDTFLAALPDDARVAVELRNATWGRQITLDLLREHRVCLVNAEYLTRPRKLYRTADFFYVRWIGEHGKFPRHDCERVNRSESLRWWRDALREVEPKLDTIYGFFNNDYAGYAVGTCNRFKEMLGMEASRTPGDRQGGLFA